MPTVIALHTAPATRLPMRSVDRVEAEAGKGIVGDRYHGTRHRHVTVQSATALAEAAEVFGAPVPAALTRRNVTISDGDVPTAPGTRIRVGGALLEAVRVAAPCKLLDDTIGAGAQGRCAAGPARSSGCWSRATSASATRPCSMGPDDTEPGRAGGPAG